MKLSCPKCGETLKYTRSMGGTSTTCTYCQSPIGMPKAEDLPPDLRAELEREEKAAREKVRRKAERVASRERKAVGSAERKEEQQQQRIEGVVARDEEDEKTKRDLARLAVAALPRLDRPVAPRPYRMLRNLGQMSQLVAVPFLALAVGYIVGGCMYGNMAHFLLGLAYLGAFWGPMVVAYLIYLAIDVAQDIRTTQALTMRIVQLLEPGAAAAPRE